MSALEECSVISFLKLAWLVHGIFLSLSFSLQQPCQVDEAGREQLAQVTSKWPSWWSRDSNSRQSYNVASQSLFVYAAYIHVQDVSVSYKNACNFLWALGLPGSVPITTPCSGSRVWLSQKLFGPIDASRSTRRNKGYLRVAHASVLIARVPGTSYCPVVLACASSAAFFLWEMGVRASPVGMGLHSRCPVMLTPR